jgi:hypothetical protein
MDDPSDAELLAALRLAGAPATEADLPLVRLVHGAFAPAMAVLMADEVARLPLEADLDPSRAPR